MELQISPEWLFSALTCRSRPFLDGQLLAERIRGHNPRKSSFVSRVEYVVVVVQGKARRRRIANRFKEEQRRHAPPQPSNPPRSQERGPRAHETIAAGLEVNELATDDRTLVRNGNLLCIEPVVILTPFDQHPAQRSLVEPIATAPC
jgi:hypothetical protein